GTGQGHHRHVDTHAIHVLDAQVPVEHLGHRRHERRAVQMNGAQPACNRLERVARTAMLLEQLEPFVVEHVGMYVDDDAHWSLIPAVRITWAHLRVSSRMTAANSWGVLVRGSAPAASARSRISGTARAATISLFRRFTMSTGVCAGATAPNQPIA